MRKHVQKLLNHQKDILSPQAVEGLQRAIRDTDAVIASNSDKTALEQQMESLEKTANKWLKPYPNPGMRENFEVLLVALTVAMGIRTFFLQPFKIPTGSMQPTLFGVTSANLKEIPNFKRPTGWGAVREWFAGVSYIHKVAEADGDIKSIEPPFGFRIFNLWQTIVVTEATGERTYTILFPPDYGEQTLSQRAGIHQGQTVHKGEDIVNLRLRAGDHLFVDRVTYNFRPPQRGEIIVFETKGIPEEQRMQYRISGEQFYIKRLVGLGGETISLKQDHIITNVPTVMAGVAPVGHLVANGKELSASTPRFENLYAFEGIPPSVKAIPYRENHYYGHAMIEGLAEGHEYKIQPQHLFVMGDNTMNSLDSRFWGDFPRDYVIGKSFFVYWPITDRFGWGYH
jgi:signal peptidase I